MAGETLIQNPEKAFHAAIDNLRRAREAYQVPSWINDNGQYWKVRRWDPALDKDKAPFKPHVVFDPDAYDPAQPYESEGQLWIPESNPARLLEDPFDLDNLRIIDREKVRDFLYRLEDLVNNAPEDKDVVAMIAMGGTIAMKRNAQGYYDPGINADELLKKAGGELEDKYAVASIDFPTLIDSSQQEMDYSAELTIAMSWIWKNASEKLQERLVGFIIPHGTDTMATSSAYTAFMLGPNLPFPVVFVGAQKTPDNKPLTDVSTNIQYAFAILKQLYASRTNVVTVFGGGTSGGAYPAIGVEKVSDRTVMAFSSPTHDKILDAHTFGEEGPRWDFVGDNITDSDSWRTPQVSAKEFKPIILRGYSPIIQIRPDMGDDPKAYYEFVKHNTTAIAILLTTFGSFTANNKMRRALTAAIEGSIEGAHASRKIIFGANPFPEGSLEHQYSTTQQLRESGIVGIHIPPIATKVKLAFAHALVGDDMPGIVNLMANTDIVGEFPRRIKKALNDKLLKEHKIGQFIHSGVPKELLKPLHIGKIKNPQVPQKPSLE